MKLLILCLFFYFVIGQRERRVDELFTQYKNIPGASIGIFQNEKLIYSKGFGVANLEQSMKTQFLILLPRVNNLLLYLWYLLHKKDILI